MNKALDLTVENFNSLPQNLRKRVANFFLRWMHWEKASTYLQILAKEQESDFYCRAKYAQSLIALGRIDEADSLVRELLLDWPSSNYTYLAQGDLCLAKGDHPEALKCFLKILEQQPKSAYAKYKCAEVYVNAKIIDKAVQYARAALEFYEGASNKCKRSISPPGLILLLADLHEKSGDTKLAKALRDEMAECESKEAKDLADLIDHATTSTGRHGSIAQYFCESLPQNCQPNDNCTSSSNNLDKNDRLILNGVRSLPIKLGKPALIKAFKGSAGCPLRPYEWKYLGAMDHLSASQVEKLIDSLIERGYLEKEGSRDRSLLELTAKGISAIESKSE